MAPLLGSLSFSQKRLDVTIQEFYHLVWLKTAQVLLNGPKCRLPRLFDQTFTRGLNIFSFFSLLSLLLDIFTGKEEAFIEDLRNKTFGLRRCCKFSLETGDRFRLLDNCLDEFKEPLQSTVIANQASLLA